MKITQKDENKYEPIQFTLETRKEAEILMAVVGNIRGQG